MSKISCINSDIYEKYRKRTKFIEGCGSYATICAKYQDSTTYGLLYERDSIYDVSIHVLIEYIKNNDIKAIEIDRIHQNLYDVLLTYNFNELIIFNIGGYAHDEQNINFERICKLFENNSIRRVCIHHLDDNNLEYILRLMDIKTIISFRIKQINLSSDNESKIWEKLRNNTHILNFEWYTKIVGICDLKIDMMMRNFMILDGHTHSQILEFALVMSMFDAPYVLLEIFDWLDLTYTLDNNKRTVCYNHLNNHRLKIRIIENVCKFRRFRNEKIENIIFHQSNAD